jgi:hypothetical protein
LVNGCVDIPDDVYDLGDLAEDSAHCSLIIHESGWLDQAPGSARSPAAAMPRSAQASSPSAKCPNDGPDDVVVVVADERPVPQHR